MEGITLTYTEFDGLLYPNIQISNNTKDDQPLGKFGRMALKYMREQHPHRCSSLRMTGELMGTMHRIDREATERLEGIFQQLMEKDPPPETDDIMVRARHMSGLKNIAEEIVINEIVLRVR